MTTMKIPDILNAVVGANTEAPDDSHSEAQEDCHSEAEVAVKHERRCFPWERQITDSEMTDTPSSAGSSPRLPTRTPHRHSQTTAHRLGMIARHVVHPYSRGSSEESTDGEKVKREKKRVSEKYSRRTVNEGLGLLERAMMEKQPTLPHDMHWKRLNSSNVGSKDRQSGEQYVNLTPLMHNKSHVLGTALLFINEDEALLMEIIVHLKRSGDYKFANILAECMKARCKGEFEETLERLRMEDE